MDVPPRGYEVIRSIAILRSPGIAIGIVHLVSETEENRPPVLCSVLRPLDDVEVVVTFRDCAEARILTLGTRRKVRAQPFIEVDHPRLPRDQRYGAHSMNRLHQTDRELLIGLVAPRRVKRDDGETISEAILELFHAGESVGETSVVNAEEHRRRVAQRRRR